MDEQKEYPFAFSVVMAVYNVEPFLQEAIDSLIAQDFGFEKIQLIMVDDGSTDGSGTICDACAAQYPDNVIVIHKENGGAASARNAGIPYAQGRYLNFMDADDKLEMRTMSEVYNFFEKFETDTDVVSVPLIFFDGRKGQHMLNYKFNKGSRVIDLYREYTMIQLSMSSAFFKHSVLWNKTFDERLSFAEDAKCIAEILINKGTLGVVRRANARYLYRRRTAGASSAIQTSEYTYSWYLPCLSFFHEEIIQSCLTKLSYIPKFIQFTLAYDLQWRFGQEHIVQGILSDEEQTLYRSKLFSLLQYIDDDIINSQKHIYAEHKLFMLEKKHSTLPSIIDRRNDIMLCFVNTFVFMLSRCQLRLEFLKLEADSCSIEGNTVMFPDLFRSVEVTAEINGQMYPCRMVERDLLKYSVDEPILKTYGFKTIFPLSLAQEHYNIKFFICADGKCIENKSLKFKKFFPISQGYKNAYYYNNGWKITTRGNSLTIKACGLSGRLKSEYHFCEELWKKNKRGARKAVLARVAYHFLKKLKRKQIWLVSDRLMKADDNGEAFWEYIQREHKDDVHAYFIIKKESTDYERLSEKGPIVNAFSFKHKLLHLLCDRNISSQAEDVRLNPFSGYDEPYRNIQQDIPFIFLQHGVTKDDISGWLNRYSKNISGFVTAAVPEYDSIINGNYYYSEKEIWLTGFPRFDRLYQNAKKYITIMPTWRKYLMLSLDQSTGIWRLNPTFLTSGFYQFYDGLLNHERLLSAAGEYGYSIQFLPHPNLQTYISLFHQNKDVRFLSMDAKYRDIYAESDLVLTDYSSACFDFAYLRKPIVYCQFDAEEFFAGEHAYTKGYFDYERDGFGEVEYDLESTVNRMIEYMENGCQLKEKYRERIDRFFAYSDQDNCRRVYEKIVALNDQKECKGET